jgi:type II secretory pathway component PulL
MERRARPSLWRAWRPDRARQRQSSRAERQPFPPEAEETEDEVSSEKDDYNQRRRAGVDVRLSRKLSPLSEMKAAAGKRVRHLQDDRQANRLELASHLESREEET